MTHDFHYYVTFMCARNVGFNPESSHKIAKCADAVDGGTAKAYDKGMLPGIKTAKGSKKPLTVHHPKSKVTFTKSRSSSILTVPWMAFHFIPSLELQSAKGNKYGLRWNTAAGGDSKAHNGDPAMADELRYSRALDSGLACSKSSRFATALIKDTAEYAKKVNKGTTIGDGAAAFLGIRSHIIADLIAHEGFAGIRSMSINALSNVTDHTRQKNKLRSDGVKDYTDIKEDEKDKRVRLYSVKSGAKGALRDLKATRLGHGQAGQLPDEPFVDFSWTRTRDKRTFRKNNYENFGMAMMVVTEALAGKVNMNYNQWRRFSNTYNYHWDDLRLITNQKRMWRNRSLIGFINCRETQETMRSGSKLEYVHEHNCDDYWVFNHMTSDLKKRFVSAAYQHLEWFHKNFYILAGCNVAEYLNASILYNAKGDYETAVQHNNKLLGGKSLTSKLGKLRDYKMDGTMIGSEHMNKWCNGNDIKPSDLYDRIKKKTVHELIPPSKTYGATYKFAK